MTKFKKVAAMLLALVMCLSLTCTAFADESYTITITGAAEGETYSAYKVLDATYATDSEGETIVTYYISSDSPYYDAISESSLFTLVKDSVSGEVTTYQVVPSDDVTASAIIALIENVKATAAASVEADKDGVATLSVSEPGYYYVTTTLGSLVILTTDTAAVSIADKNSQPTVEKVVKEDSTGNTGSSNTAAIGDVVEFTATIKDAGDVNSVVFHDTMESGLSFNSDSVKVYVGETQITTGYTLVTSPTDKCTFEIEFEDGTITGDAVVTIKYTATVTADAEIYSETNDNSCYVSYGESSTTEISKTTTTVFEFKLTKVIAGTETILDNAVFTLTAVDSHNGNAVLTFVQNDDGNYVLSSDSTASSEITVGTAKIIGLDAGTYTLTETSAPDGYNKLTSSITVVIDEDGTLTVGGESATSVTVENSAGTTLPGTGGMGTTVFYIAGAMMMLAAAVLLITKKRMAR